MSVIGFDINEWNEVFTTILHRYVLGNCLTRFFTWEEEQIFIAEMKRLNKPFDIDEIKEQRLKWFIDNLAISNQIAYGLTYSHGDDFNIRQNKDYKDIGISKVMTPKKLYDKLRSIRYNMISNGGRCFCTEDTMQKLNDLIDAVGHEVISTST